MYQRHAHLSAVRFAAFAFCLAVCLGKAALAAESPGDSARNAQLLDKLVSSYPDFLASHDKNTLIWKDGTAMTFDDGKGEKDFETRIDHPDLEDEFYTPYPVGRTGIPPGIDIDPGRVRYEPFFAKMYGDCKKGEVTKKMVDVVWLPKHGGKKLKITSVNGVDQKLKAVSDELDKLPDSFVKYLTPSGGTYNCRDRRHRPAERPRRRHRHRHQRRLVGLLAEPPAGRRQISLQEPHPVGDRRDFREARLHLGR